VSSFQALQLHLPGRTEDIYEWPESG